VNLIMFRKSSYKDSELRTFFHRNLIPFLPETSVVIFKRSHCGSAVKWWNEKINKIKRSWVCSPALATFYKKCCNFSKWYRQKIIQHAWRVFTQETAGFLQKLILSLIFQEKRQFYRRFWDIVKYQRQNI
jgi:hypothetical protein